VKEVFQAYQESMDDEQRLRENVKVTTKDLERQMKTLLGILQGIHQNVSSDNVQKIVAEARAMLVNDVQPLLVDLKGKVPAGDYFRFNDMWRFTTSKLCFCCSLIWFLEHNTAPLRQQVAEMLGLSIDPRAESIFLDTEDYLHGLLQMSTEISRWCINCVAQGDVQRPEKIFRLLSDLQVAYSELNLKNDNLRRMFDGLKYDVKRVEQVMYDITVRGLNPKSSSESTSEEQSADPAAAT